MAQAPAKATLASSLDFDYWRNNYSTHRYGSFLTPFAASEPFFGLPIEIATVIVLSLSFIFWRKLLTIISDAIFKYRERQGQVLLSPGCQDKFSETIFNGAYYTVVWIWGLSIALREDWAYNPVLYWQDLFHSMSFNEFMFYMVELSYYTYGLFTTLFLDTRRKDWYLLISHHLGAIGLIAYSWRWGFHRIGIMVLLTLDPSDVFLCWSKALHYVCLDLPSKVLFVVLLLSWIACRLFGMAWKVLYPAWIAVKIIDAQRYPYHWIEFWAFQFLLWFIYILQIYWFYELIRVLINVVFNDSLEDLREENVLVKKGDKQGSDGNLSKGSHAKKNQSNSKNQKKQPQEANGHSNKHQENSKKNK